MGEEKLLGFISVSSWNSCITPDGIKNFCNIAQLLEYISEKCGKDVANCFKTFSERLYDDLLEAEEEIERWKNSLDTYTLEAYSKKGRYSPVLELKALRGLKEDYDKAIEILSDITEEIGKEV